MDFGEAIKLLKQDKKVRRSGWNGKGMWVKLFRSWHVSDKMQSKALGLEYTQTPTMLDFLVTRTAENSFIAWTISQADAMATDWEEVLS